MDIKLLICEILFLEDIVCLEVEWFFLNWKVLFVECCGGVLIRMLYVIVCVDGI